MEITFQYWNKLASQTIIISSLLAGFSITIIANLLVSELQTKISKYIMVAAILAACMFLISLFAMTGVVMMTTEGFPQNNVTQEEIRFPRLIGGFSIILGVMALLCIISLAGWTKSKIIGVFSTIIGILTLIFILFFLI